ncbi:hypothetical protein AAW31_13990 [Nitrosomonas communis]|uniref:Uncharacterized protein n=1 Tax=Nitrosomonas communis TaxID=44574 RepID=A0A0F7KDQ2_9PROT|nr:hypothetical protein AAW31_13990 [Nitrosomonas communis]
MMIKVRHEPICIKSTWTDQSESDNLTYRSINWQIVCATLQRKADKSVLIKNGIMKIKADHVQMLASF